MSPADTEHGERLTHEHGVARVSVPGERAVATRQIVMPPLAVLLRLVVLVVARRPNGDHGPIQDPTVLLGEQEVGLGRHRDAEVGRVLLRDLVLGEVGDELLERRPLEVLELRQATCVVGRRAHVDRLTRREVDEDHVGRSKTPVGRLTIQVGFERVFRLERDLDVAHVIERLLDYGVGCHAELRGEVAHLFRLGDEHEGTLGSPEVVLLDREEREAGLGLSTGAEKIFHRHAFERHTLSVRGRGPATGPPEHLVEPGSLRLVQPTAVDHHQRKAEGGEKLVRLLQALDNVLPKEDTFVRTRDAAVFPARRDLPLFPELADVVASDTAVRDHRRVRVTFLPNQHLVEPGVVEDPAPRRDTHFRPLLRIKHDRPPPKIDATDNN